MKKRLLAALAGASLCACAHLPPLILPSDPLSAAEHFKLGDAYAAQGLKNDAAAQYEAAARLGSPEAFVALGNLAFESGDLKAAEKNYRRALKLSPHLAGAENNLASVYLRQDRKLDQAESLALDALDRDESLKPYVLDTLANVYLRQRRYPEALVAADQAEKAAASDAALLSRLAETRKSIEVASSPR